MPTTARLLAGGAAGDFSTMTFDERAQVAEIVVEAVAGACRSPWARRRPARCELQAAGQDGAAAGRDFIQVSLPVLLHPHRRTISTSMSRAAADAAPISASSSTTPSGPATNMSFGMVERLADDPECRRPEMGDAAHRCDGVRGRRSRTSRAASPSSTTTCCSRIAPCWRWRAAFEVHLCNYWPEWGIKLIDDGCGAATTPRCSACWSKRRCPSTSCGSRSRRTTPAAMAISTSSAWSWSGLHFEPLPSADARHARPVTATRPAT